MHRDYLLQYGVSSFVGRFRASEGVYARGEKVAIHTPRGQEFGTILCEMEPHFSAPLSTAIEGTILHRITDADGRDCAEIAKKLEAIIDVGNAMIEAEELPCRILDAEELGNREVAILHVTTWGEANLTPIVERLAQQFSRTIRIQQMPRPVAEPAREESGCGKPGCGSGGCSTGSCGTSGGCGTSSCSRGTANSAEELTEKFRNLREQMEQHVHGRRELV